MRNLHTTLYINLTVFFKQIILRFGFFFLECSAVITDTYVVASPSSVWTGDSQGNLTLIPLCLNIKIKLYLILQNVARRRDLSPFPRKGPRDINTKLCPWERNPLYASA